MLNAERSTYIAAIDPLPLEALLGESAQISVIGSSDGKSILEDAQRLCPDFLLLDGVLRGVDSLYILEQMRWMMPAPPRVLYLGRDENWLAYALQRGADAAALRNSDSKELLRLAECTAQKLLPELAAPWEEARMEIAQKFAAFLGIPDVMKGKQYICLAVSMLVCAPQLAASYAGLLYPLIASRCATSPQAVEKAIRTAVESTWLSGSLNAIQSLFGYSVDAERGKPTNAEFLAMLSGDARRELAHHMVDQARKTPEKMEKMP